MPDASLCKLVGLSKLVGVSVSPGVLYNRDHLRCICVQPVRQPGQVLGLRVRGRCDRGDSIAHPVCDSRPRQDRADAASQPRGKSPWVVSATSWIMVS